ncbi:Hypothetical protein PHPALM_37820, partial [Phytophthora palmivora]
MSFSEYDDDFDVDTIATDTDTEHTRESSSLVKDLQLSQLCRAKLAIALNAIHHVQMCEAHEGEEDATVYVLDVFLQSTPRGITKKSNRIMDVRSPDFQVQHRYSAFRALREQIGEAVKVPKDKSHAQWLLEAWCRLRWKIEVDNVSDDKLLFEIDKIVKSVKNETLPDVQALFKKELQFNLKETDVSERVLQYFLSCDRIIDEHGLQACFDTEDGTKEKCTLLISSLAPETLKEDVKNSLRFQAPDAKRDE